MKPFLILIAILMSSCALSSKEKALKHTEVVLKPKMKITATNPNGTLTVEADGEISRIFSGKGWKKRSTLIPRRTRWYGSLGLYDPASSNSPYGRLLVDEGKLFFNNEQEALRYLYSVSRFYKPVFNNSGLVVGYSIEKIPGGEDSHTVQIWQIYINGKKPTKMKGADDSAIILSGGQTPDAATPNKAPIGYKVKLGKEIYQPKKANKAQ